MYIIKGISNLQCILIVLHYCKSALRDSSYQRPQGGSPELQPVLPPTLTFTHLPDIFIFHDSPSMRLYLARIVPQNIPPTDLKQVQDWCRKNRAREREKERTQAWRLQYMLVLRSAINNSREYKWCNHIAIENTSLSISASRVQILITWNSVQMHLNVWILTCLQAEEWQCTSYHKGNQRRWKSHHFKQSKESKAIWS